MESDKPLTEKGIVRIIERQLRHFSPAERRSTGETLCRHLQGVAARIRMFRELRGLEQVELATACGFESHSIISRYETGEVVPDEMAIGLIALALDITPVDLVNTATGHTGMIIDKMREATAARLQEVYTLLANPSPNPA